LPKGERGVVNFPVTEEKEEDGMIFLRERKRNRRPASSPRGKKARPQMSKGGSSLSLRGEKKKKGVDVLRSVDKSIQRMSRYLIEKEGKETTLALSSLSLRRGKGRGISCRSWAPKKAAAILGAVDEERRDCLILTNARKKKEKSASFRLPGLPRKYDLRKAEGRK